MNTNFPPFQKRETRIYVLVSDSKVSKSPKIAVTSFEELWKRYWKIVSEKTGRSKKSYSVKLDEAEEEDYRKAFFKLFHGDQHPSIYPVFRNPQTSFLFKALGLKLDDSESSQGSVRSFENLDDEDGSEDSESSEEKEKPKKKTPAKTVSKKKGKLPTVYLVHFPQRKGWPFALLGETKPLKDVLKFPDSKEKISLFVSNVNKEFGPGWNIKEEAVDIIKELDGQELELQEFEDVREYRGFCQD